MMKSHPILRGVSDNRTATAELDSILDQIAAAKLELENLNQKRSRAMLDISLAEDRLHDFREEARGIAKLLGLQMAA